MNTNAKKRVYVSPKVEVHDVETMTMLAASPIDPQKSESGTEHMIEENLEEEYEWE